MTSTTPRRVGELDAALLEDLRRRARARRRRRALRPAGALALVAVLGGGLALGLRDPDNDAGTVTVGSDAPSPDTSTATTPPTTDESSTAPPSVASTPPPSGATTREPTTLVATTADGLTVTLRLYTEHELLDRVAELHEVLAAQGQDMSHLADCAPDAVRTLEMTDASGSRVFVAGEPHDAHEPVGSLVRHLGDDVIQRVGYWRIDGRAAAVLAVRAVADGIVDPPYPSVLARADVDGWHLFVLGLATDETVLPELNVTATLPDGTTSSLDVSNVAREGDAAC